MDELSVEVVGYRNTVGMLFPGFTLKGLRQMSREEILKFIRNEFSAESLGSPVNNYGGEQPHASAGNAAQYDSRANYHQ